MTSNWLPNSLTIYSVTIQLLGPHLYGPPLWVFLSARLCQVSVSACFQENSAYSNDGKGYCNIGIFLYTLTLPQSQWRWGLPPVRLPSTPGYQYVQERLLSHTKNVSYKFTSEPDWAYRVSWILSVLCQVRTIAWCTQDNFWPVECNCPRIIRNTEERRTDYSPNTKDLFNCFTHPQRISE